MQPRAGSSAGVVHRWLTHAGVALTERRDELNAINVFPVPDSDTGSNLVLTITAAADALPPAPVPDRDRREPVDLGALLAVAGSEALEHARGNSGTIVAVMLNAMAEPLAGVARLTPSTLASSLERARLLCWSALSDPVPGTMLSVLEAASDACARHAHEHEGDESNQALVTVVDGVLDAAAAAVIRTEQQNDVLARAQVVDSGAVGLLLLLQCLRWALTGEPIASAPLEGLDGFVDPVHPAAMDGVEIMCSMNLTPLDAASLRIALDDMGDSVILTAIGPGPVPSADGGQAVRWRLHAHVPHDDHQRALAILRDAGDVENLSVTSLRPEGVREDLREQQR